MLDIPFNHVEVGIEEFDNIRQAIAAGKLSGNGPFTQQCEAWLSNYMGGARALLVHSCTAALEMAALLLDLQRGDEVIMPSYTFPSTANAVVLRGAVPVFADIEKETLNLSADIIRPLVTKRTKAIFAVHYAGRPPEMQAIMKLADELGLIVVEDAAQSLGTTQYGLPAGRSSHMSAFSFHETKNVIAGEGGALILNDLRYAERALLLREKGTNRQAFLDGAVDRYSWVDLGSSYLPSELGAAFLLAQLMRTRQIAAHRSAIWERYHAAFSKLRHLKLELPTISSPDVNLNGHIFHFLLPHELDRSVFLAAMAKLGVQCVSHFVPLHSSVAGQRFGRAPLGCPITEDVARRIVRLPVHSAIDSHSADRVVRAVESCVTKALR